MKSHFTPVVSLIFLALTCGLAASAGAEMPATAGSIPAVSQRTPISGLWVWRIEYLETDQAQDELLAFCGRYGFNRLLVQIHWNQSQQFRIPAQLARLLKKAHEQGIAVEALDGAPDMARKENWKKTLAMLDTILAFNRELPASERFAGMHYDIEPYTGADWKQGDVARKQQIMLEYVQFLAQARDKVKAADPAMVLSVDIPMWYDSRTSGEYDITYDGQKKNFHQHIQDLTDYIGIMSYRRSAEGNNGVIAQVANELDYAEKIGKFICPALETIQLTVDPQISFYGLPPSRFWETKHAVEKALADRPGFGGMLIHSYRGVVSLFKTADE